MSQQPPSEPVIALHFEKFSAFVEGYASNLSLGGMFFETDADRPVGSIVNFEIKLVDGFRLMQGIGEVIWIRRVPAGADRPTGLGVRFQGLDDKGRELILKILEERVRSGLEPFDVEEIPDDVLNGEGGDESLDTDDASNGVLDTDDVSSGVVSNATSSTNTAASSVGPTPLTSPEPVAAPASTVAADAQAVRPPVDFEQKILGEDGFTLLDTELPEPSEEASQTSEESAQVEFDAPWGKALPELPEEVLGEDSGAKEAVAGPSDANEIETESGLFELDAAIAEAEPTSAELGHENTDQQDALDDSFFLATEAAAEIDTAPEDAFGEPDFEDIDFSVSPEDAEEPSAAREAGSGGADFAFDPDPEDQLPALESMAAAEEPIEALGTGGENPFADSMDDEDPTILGAGADAFEEDPTVLTSTPLAAAHEPEASPGDFELDFDSVEEAEEPARQPGLAEFPEAPVVAAASVPDPVFSEPPKPMPQVGGGTEFAPTSAPGPSIGEGGSVSGTHPATVSVAGAPVAVQDYEDDLFAGESGSGPGQVVRQALSGRMLAGGAILLALAVAAFFFRGPIAELMGLTEPRRSSTPPVAGGRPAEVEAGATELSADTAAASDIADRAGGTAAEDPAAETVPVIEEVEVSETLPPGSDVASDPAAESGEGSSGEGQAKASPTIEMAPPSLEATSASASRVERISWRQGDDGTLVTVSLDGRLDDSRYLHMPLEYNPAREMVKIIGIDEPYVSGRIEVGSPDVQQIRVGHHTQAEGAEIHVVFDYPNADSRLVTVRNLGDRLEVLIASSP